MHVIETPQRTSRSRLGARGAAVVGAAVLALGLGLAACGSSASTTGAAPPAAASTSAAASTGTVVEVGMKEFSLDLSQKTFTPGTYTFHTTNTGKFPHTITIDGPGVDKKSAGGPSKSGESGTLTVTLQPGTYQMWCPVGNHKTQGMQTTFTVA